MYSEYVNENVSHSDQGAFQTFADEQNENGEVMVIPSSFMQRIYKLLNAHNYEDDYKKLNEMQGESIIFHRVGGGRLKYFQMNDVIRDWIDSDVLNRMMAKCPECFENNEKWQEAVRRVDMKQFDVQKGKKLQKLRTKVVN